MPEEVKQERWNALMARQQKISARRLKRKVGTRQQVIIDEVGPTVSKGRSKADAPQIDGAVYVSSRRPLRVGEIVTAKIERADEYDLHGSVAGSDQPDALLTAPAVRLYGRVMIFNRTNLRAAFRRRSIDDDGSRRVRRQR